jgi:hypothetical protein
MKRMNRLAAVAVALMLVFASGAALAAEDTIKIGAFFDLSGPASFIGTPTKLVADMVVDKINKEGGVNGKPIELIVGDTEGDPAKAVNIAKKFIYKDKVAAIIGPTRTGTGMAVKKIIHAGKVPTFMTVGGDPVIMGGPKLGPFDWVFKSPQRSSVAVKRLYMYLKDKGLTKIALLTASDGFGKDGVPLADQTGPEFGIDDRGPGSLRPQGHRHDRPVDQCQKRRSPGHGGLDHRPGRIHRLQKQSPAGYRPAPVPVPRAARSQVYRAGRQGLRGRPHAGHQIDGRRCAARHRPAETGHPGVCPALHG